MLPCNRQIATRDQQKGGDIMKREEKTLLDIAKAIENSQFDVKYIKFTITLKKTAPPKATSSKDKEKAGK